MSNSKTIADTFSPVTRGETAEADAFDSRVFWALFIAALCCGLLITMAPMDVLLNNCIPDDSFYAHKTALNMARGLGSTFDGVNRTNGYHPLWVLLEVPIFWFFGGGGENPIRAILALQAVLYGLTAILVYRLLRKAGDRLCAAAAAFVWLAFTVLLLINGLETVLYCALLYGTVIVYLRTYELCERSGVGVYAALGVLLGLTFLGRTDSVFFILFVGLDLIVRLGWRLQPGAVAKLAACFVPAALIGGAYLLTNLIYFGGLMQVSGAAKRYYSKAIFESATKQGQSALLVYWNNLLWPLKEPTYFITVSVLSIPLVFAFMWWRNRRAGGKDPMASLYLRCWPLWLSLFSLYVFYGTVYMTGFSQTSWYYTPAYIHLAFVALGLALLARSFAAAWPVIMCGLAYIFAEPVTPKRLLILALLLAAAGALSRLPAIVKFRPKVPVWCEPVLFALALGWALYYVRGYSSFLVAAALLGSAITALSALARPRTIIPSRAVAVACVGIAVCTFPVRYVVQRNMELHPNYNYMLYRAAIWVRDNTAPEITITAGSAGILGYFSDRRVLNTDGLINSYGYLREYLMRGRSAEYLKRSDAFIDVYGFDYAAAMKTAYPGGSFIEVPQELKTASFRDGPNSRRLQVFVLDWRNRRLFRTAEQGEPIPNGDFEQGLTGWHKTGDAFDAQPTYGDNPYARGVFPAMQHGEHWVGTYERRQAERDLPSAQGNGPTGTLTSDPFVLRGSQLSFLVGGGDLPGTRVDVIVEGSVVFTARGERIDSMRRVAFDIRPYQGRTAVVKIVDEESSPWGAINADDFRLVP